MNLKNKLVPRIAVIALSSPLEVGAGNAQQKVLELEEVLKGKKCDVILSAALSTHEESAAIGRKLAGLFPDMVVFLPVCWFEDYLVTDFIEECGVPLLLWALPGMETGSLCGTAQLGCYLKFLEHPYHHVFGETGDQETVDLAMVFIRACALKSRLRRAKVGLAGNRINGMTYTGPHEFALKKTIGPRIFQLDLGDITRMADESSEDDASSVWTRLKNNAGLCTVDDKAGMESARMYLALRDVVSKNGLDALSVGCYPKLMGKVCLAASLLADDGIPLACEGDVNGAVGQLILTILSGAPTHNTDFLDPMKDKGIVFTHCGSGSFSLAEKKKEIVLSSVRLMGQGACALFPARTGPVTLISLIAADNGYQVAMLCGEAVRTSMIFPGNPVLIQFKKSFREIGNWVFEEGVGHHWMIAYGDCSGEISQWARMAGSGLCLKHLC